MIKLHICIQGHQAGQDVGKSKAAVNAASHCSQVAHLNAHDMACTFLKNASEILVKPLVCLQLAQGAHGANPEFFLGFLDFIKSQAGQVHDGTFGHTGHLKPHHASHNQAAALLA